MTKPLMAKSGEPTEIARTLVGHTRNVLDAVDALFDPFGRLAASWIRFFGLGEADLAWLLRHLRIAAAAHDWGKANDGFQELVAGGGEQVLRHEHVSCLLLGDSSLVDWLRSAEIDVGLILGAVLSHHVKAGLNTVFAPIGLRGTVRVASTHPDFQEIWRMIKTEVGVSFPGEPSFPRLWRNDDIEQLRECMTKTLNRLKRDLSDDPDRRRRLQALRSALIVADAAGSAKPRMGTDLKTWIAESFATVLTAEKVREEVVEKRVDELRKRGAWDDRKGFSQFQLEIAGQGPRVLLTAPCGSGKTLAAWNWISARLAERPAARVVFLYPTRATAAEGFRDYVSWAPEADAGLMSGTASYELEGMFATQEDERKGRAYRVDPRLFALGNWRKRIFSATADQFLPFLQYAYGPLCMLPVLADSVLVVDEVHSFDGSMFSTLKHFLTEFPTIPVLCMTATLPAERRDDLIRCGLTSFPETIPDDLAAIAKHPRYQVVWIDPDQALGVMQEALNRNRRVLRVCNRVDDCREAFSLFREEPLYGEAPMAYCYHSRFKLDDRKERHKALIGAFQEAARDEGNPRAVFGATTQVCEMSLDLDAEVLVTDLAPISSLIQRMGRCNRDSEKMKTRPPGLVYVVVRRPGKDKPYGEEELATAQAFVNDLVGLDRDISQADLDRVYAKHDARVVEPLKHCPFLGSGPYAEAREESFRDVDEFAVRCILDYDVPRATAAIKRGESIDGLIVPAPRFLTEPPGPGSGLPRWLRVAPGRRYDPETGFDGRSEPRSEGDDAP